MSNFNYFTKTATKPMKSWCVRDRALFEYFNPNGANHRKYAVDERITAAVAAGKCASGAILAYGSMNDHYSRLLSDIVCLNAKTTYREVMRLVDALNREIKYAEDFLASL